MSKTEQGGDHNLQRPGSWALTKDAVAAALARPRPDVPTVTDRMLRRDNEGRSMPRPMPPTHGPAPRLAAVLIPFYVHDDALWIIFTRRAAHLEHHRGQISFPGGSVEAADDSFLATALREFEEELGLSANLVTIWGQLKPVYVPPSHFIIHPLVGFLGPWPHCRPAAGEVAEVIEVPLAALAAPGCFGYRPKEENGRWFLEPGFAYGKDWIWGATAIILDQMLARLDLSAS